MSVFKDKDKVKFLVLLFIIGLLLFLGKYFHVDVDMVRDFLKKIPFVYQAVVYVFLYCLVTFFVWLMAKDLFKILGALLFGPVWSTLFVWIAEIINAWIFFHLTRFLGRGYVEDHLKGKFKDIDVKLSRLNFFWLFLFRAAPLIPFRLLDLAVGLTKIPFRKYLLAVIAGSPLRIFLVQSVLFGVGSGIFDYQVVSQYLLQNPILFVWGLAYIILIIPVLLKLRLKD